MCTLMAQALTEGDQSGWDCSHCKATQDHHQSPTKTFGAAYTVNDKSSEQRKWEH